MGATTSAPWAADSPDNTARPGGIRTPPPVSAPWADGGAMGARPTTPMPTGVSKEPAGPPPNL
eukprot:scaffold652087_cov47-Prasinocladus_malaysianus.AAC.1